MIPISMAIWGYTPDSDPRLGKKWSIFWVEFGVYGWGWDGFRMWCDWWIKFGLKDGRRKLEDGNGDDGKHGSFTSSDRSSAGSLVQHDKEPPVISRNRWLKMEPMTHQMAVENFRDIAMVWEILTRGPPESIGRWQLLVHYRTHGCASNYMKIIMSRS